MPDFTLFEGYKANYISDLWIISKFSRVWFRQQWHTVATFQKAADSITGKA